jgi:hypothetical protein
MTWASSIYWKPRARNIYIYIYIYIYICVCVCVCVCGGGGCVCVWMSAFVLLVLFAGFRNLTVQGRCYQNFMLVDLCFFFAETS